MKTLRSHSFQVVEPVLKFIAYSNSVLLHLFHIPSGSVCFSLNCKLWESGTPEFESFPEQLSKWKEQWWDWKADENGLRGSMLPCWGFIFYFRMAVTRRTMFQKGEVHNKPSGFWGMIKSVTTSATGSESILYPSAWFFFSTLDQGQKKK